MGNAIIAILAAGVAGWIFGAIWYGVLSKPYQRALGLNPDDCKVQLTRSPGHVRNFLDCVKSRAESVCPIDAAMKVDVLCHMGDIAIRLGRKLSFDLKHERFIEDEAANQRLKCRPMRKPWHL